MTREEFIQYLTEKGCTVVRHDKKGYTVMRNVINGLISGIPKDDVCLPATMCRICRTLGLDEVPEVAKAFVPIIDHVQKKHGLK